MTAKEWLNRGFKLNREIEQLVEAKQRAEALARKAVPSVSGKSIQTSRKNITEGKLVSYSEYTGLIYRRVNALFDVQQEIVEAVGRVEPPLLRALLTARYINYKTWDEIAAELGYDLRWVHRLHREALEQIGRVLEKP